MEALVLAPPLSQGGFPNIGYMSFLGFAECENDHVFLLYSFTRIDMSIGPDRIGFGGRLNMIVFIQPFLSLLSFLELLSYPDFKRWESDYVFSPYQHTCCDTSIGPDGIEFGCHTYLCSFWHNLTRSFFTVFKGSPEGNPLCWRRC